MDGLEGGGPGLQVPMASRSSRRGTCVVLVGVGGSRVWSQVMQCSRCRLWPGVAVAVPVTSTAPEARVHGLRSPELESEAIVPVSEIT